MNRLEELLIDNFAQVIATGHMTVAMGEQLSQGMDASDLIFRISFIDQLQQLFDVESQKPVSNIEILEQSVFVINSLQNDYRLEGEVAVAEVAILPIPPKVLRLVLGQTVNLPGEDGESHALRPWTDVIFFTFNGSNRTHALSFIPNSFGAGTFLNDKLLNPYSEFTFTDSNITISSSLEVGTSYKITTQYFV